MTLQSHIEKKISFFVVNKSRFQNLFLINIFKLKIKLATG